MPSASDSETHPHTGIETSHDDSTSVEREQESTFSKPTHNVDSEIGLPRHVRSELLHSIGVTSRNRMTPRKQLLFYKLCSMRRTLKRYEHNWKSCRKDVFGVKNIDMWRTSFSVHPTTHRWQHQLTLAATLYRQRETDISMTSKSTDLSRNLLIYRYHADYYQKVTNKI
ncbi:uncharacterized protein LOC125505892 [Dendroctonus ponderosae]|uniref:uncharacterized protein LOC125505892 n=1 Tax=Dendroctonus ponderosae TaxID=77166 RepID=UPI0020361A92|nr:uncharacterized protein LOC125505892 [Dendroctonus ponderosae]